MIKNFLRNYKNNFFFVKGNFTKASYNTNTKEG